MRTVTQPTRREGWRCPACGKGNSPGVAKCQHCDDTQVKTVVVPNPTEEFTQRVTLPWPFGGAE